MEQKTIWKMEEDFINYGFQIYLFRHPQHSKHLSYFTNRPNQNCSHTPPKMATAAVKWNIKRSPHKLALSLDMHSLHYLIWAEHEKLLVILNNYFIKTTKIVYFGFMRTPLRRLVYHTTESAPVGKEQCMSHFEIYLFTKKNK